MWHRISSKKHNSFPGRLSGLGLGIIEVIVAMFLLALLAMAFVPVLVQGLRTTSRNVVLATATQLVANTIAQARSQGACLSATAVQDPDIKGMWRSVACSPFSSSSPGTVLLTVTVRSGPQESAPTLAEAKTVLFVKAAS